MVKEDYAQPLTNADDNYPHHSITNEGCREITQLFDHHDCQEKKTLNDQPNQLPKRKLDDVSRTNQTQIVSGEEASFRKE